MKFQIAIPSYQRESTLVDYTLLLLRRLKVDMSIVTIFVADKAAKEAYFKAVKDPKITIQVAAPGMRAVRNYIQGYYPEGTLLVNIDDDVKGLYYKVNDKKVLPLPSLMPMVEKGFETCLECNAALWGIYPVMNAMFMKKRIRTDLTYIVGAFWGVVNSHDAETYVTIDDKEDFERSIKYYLRDGKVIRLEYFSVLTNYYGQAGGMQVDRTEDRVTESAKYLVKTYPEFCKLNTSKKSGHTEVRLRSAL